MTATELQAQRTRDPESTRSNLLEAAFFEIYEKGYGAASLDDILARAGVTKGALYHHFGSKADLLHAVIDEVVRVQLVDRWLTSLEASDDPVEALIETGTKFMRHQLHEDLERGCPLNNLVQELSNADEGFRLHLTDVFDNWREGIARGLKRGQKLGNVRSDVDPEATATFIVSCVEGLAGTAKSTRDRKLTAAAGKVFFQFIQSLKADPEQSKEAA